MEPKVFLVVLSALIVSASAQIFRLPEKRACERRKVHFERFGKRYHFSWLEVGRDTKFDWEGARNYCRRFCMDSISFESPREYRTFQNIIKTENIPYIWTGGRKCNFDGCDRPDLQPAIVNGWYWAPIGKKIPAKNKCPFCDWSNTGGIKEAQPDNREFRESRNGNDEACIAVLNNFYNDGISWHDVACGHVKPIICQDSQPLLDFVDVI